MSRLDYVGVKAHVRRCLRHSTVSDLIGLLDMAHHAITCRKNNYARVKKSSASEARASRRGKKKGRGKRRKQRCLAAYVKLVSSGEGSAEQTRTLL